MAATPIVFAMANPTPEIMPEEAAPHVRVMATGRSDYPEPDQQRAAFPASSAACSTCARRSVNDEMKLAAAHALAGIVGRRRAERGVHHAVHVRPARGAHRGRRRRGRRGPDGRGAAAPRLAAPPGAMPIAKLPDVELYYEETGQGVAAALECTSTAATSARGSPRCGTSPGGTASSRITTAAMHRQPCRKARAILPGPLGRGPLSAT